MMPFRGVELESHREKRRLECVVCTKRVVTHTVKTAQNNVHNALNLSGHAQGEKAKSVSGRGGFGGGRQPLRGVLCPLLLGRVNSRRKRWGGLPKWACFVGNSA